MSPSLSVGQQGAGPGIRRQIAKYELNGGKNHLRQSRCLKESGGMSHGTVEHTSLTITLDPNHPVIPVRANVPGLEIGLVCIEADEDMQLLTRIRPIGQEVIELVGVDKALTT